jgi:hypothetical protein
MRGQPLFCGYDSRAVWADLRRLIQRYARIGPAQLSRVPRGCQAR